MSMLLTFFSQNAYQECVLPDIEILEYRIRLDSYVFGLEEDNAALLENVSGRWHFCSYDRDPREEGIALIYPEDYKGEELKGGERFVCMTRYGERIAIWVSTGRKVFQSYEMYDISAISKFSVGRGSDCEICYSAGGPRGEIVSLVHALFVRQKGQWKLRDRSTNGCFLEGTKISKEAVLHMGDCIYIYGLSLVWLGETIAVSKGEGELTVKLPKGPAHTPVKNYERHNENRVHIAPRISEKVEERVIVLEGLPDKALTANASSADRSVMQMRNAYRDYLSGIRRQLDMILENSKKILNDNYPPLPSKVSLAGRSGRLWNMTPADSDYLCIRMGLGSPQSRILIDHRNWHYFDMGDELVKEADSILDEYRQLEDVPVCADLGSAGSVGISSDRFEDMIGIATILILGLAFNLSPYDVKLVFLLSEDSRISDELSYVHWLPHVWNEGEPARYIAMGKAECDRLSLALTDHMRNSASMEQTYIIITDKAYLIPSELKKRGTKNGESPRIINIYLGDKSIPSDTELIIEKKGNYSGIYRSKEGRGSGKTVAFDKVSRDYPLKAVSYLFGLKTDLMGSGSPISEQLSFLDLYKAESPDDLDIEGRWRVARCREGIRARIGVGQAGVPVILDLSEGMHGPHGLIAGMTGSGKSELLRTLILSLAVNYAPEELELFLIDYKGGGMADVFRDLPHTIGSVSNLSGEEARRALTALRGEMTRRQLILKRAAASHVDDLARVAKDKSGYRLSHLFIIIDEFALLARDMPEFMPELAAVAQAGRSLGLHLILATQRPAGAVDANIRSNVSFRIALRVQTREDSMEVIGSPEAAGIEKAGRALLTIGESRAATLFQTAYSAAVYDNDKEPAIMLSSMGSPDKAAMRRRSGDRQGHTELELICRQIEALRKPKKSRAKAYLYLPSLSEDLTMEGARELLDRYSVKGAGDTRLMAALLDAPEKASYIPWYPGRDDGNIAVMGMQGSGRTSLIQSILFSLVNAYSPEQMAIYIVEMSGKNLEPFAYYPHVGGYISEADTDKIGPLLHMLEERISTGRAEVYKKDAPFTMLVIDGMAAVRDRTEGRYDEELIHIASEGVGSGVNIIVSGSEFGLHDIPIRMADSIRTRIVMRMADRASYRMLLGRRAEDDLPLPGDAGSGLMEMEGKVRALRTALVYCSEPAERMDHISADARRADESYVGVRPEPVPYIPEPPLYSIFEEQLKALGRPYIAGVGYDTATASIVTIDTDHKGSFLICGRKRSGKSGLLNTIIRSSQTAAEPPYLIIIDSGANDIEILHERIQGAISAMKEGRRVMIAMDDLRESMGLIYSPQGMVKDLPALITDMMERDDAGLVTICAVAAHGDEEYLSSYTLAEYIFPPRAGVHLGGNADENRVLDFEDISYHELAARTRPGTGYLTGLGKGGSIALLTPIQKG